MMCRSPHVVYGMAYPCGRCMPCRFNKRREWTHRIMLESMCHDANCFLTLTYSDLWVPRLDKDLSMTLKPDDVRLFMNSLRMRLWREEGIRIRFFAVGEYGDVSERPHYHIALFGRGGSPDVFTQIWGKGMVHIGRLELFSAQYIAGYVTKKLTKKDDDRLCGRFPEFVRMSRDPGLGVPYLSKLKEALEKDGVADLLEDVPNAVQVGSKLLPYGRTLRRRLRVLLGRSENAPQSTLDRLQASLLPVRMAARSNSAQPSFKKALICAGDGRVANFDARERLFKKRRML